MDIQPTRSSILGVDSKATEATDPTHSSTPPAPEDSTASQGVADLDRVELSEAARARVAQEEDPALEHAREVLRDWPTLDPERKAMILARLEEGFYSKPESVKQVAEGLYADLTERPLEAKGSSPQA